MSEHSPLPWRVVSGPGWVDDIVDANGAHVVCTGHDYGEGGYIGTHDARFICCAVNCHAEAMNALQMAHGYFASYGNGNNEASEHFRRIAAVLGKMRGEA